MNYNLTNHIEGSCYTSNGGPMEFNTKERKNKADLDNLHRLDLDTGFSRMQILTNARIEDLVTVS